MIRIFALASLLILSPCAFAQAQEPVTSEEQQKAAPADAELPERDLRIQLATKMHQIRPTSVQVEVAIAEMARRSVPEDQREEFSERMLGAMDIKALEQASIDAMVEVFTLSELERMVAYYLTPEAQSISAKMPMYQGIVQPQIIKMLDNAMLEMRTGNAGKGKAPQ